MGDGRGKPLRILPRPRPQTLHQAFECGARQPQESLPVFEKAEIAQRWAGYIDVTPDAVPVIDAIDSIPGFHIATGFSGHGFGIGPAAGRLMADIVTGKPPVVDRKNFRFSRFHDGSKIELISGF